MQPIVISTIILGHFAAKIFPVLNDFEKYPLFVPGFREARITHRGADGAYQSISKVRIIGFTEKLHSRTDTQEPYRIHTTSTGRWFIKNFLTTWELHDVGDGCRISLSTTIILRNELDNVPTISTVKQKIASQTLTAFEERIHALLD